jgi:hypothetical protein
MVWVAEVGAMKERLRWVVTLEVGLRRLSLTGKGVRGGGGAA